MFRRIVMAGIVATSLLAAPVAEAKLGGFKSYGSSSYSHSSSSQDSSRLGGGRSVGMQRDDVANRVRQGESPANASGHSAVPQQPPAQQGYRPGWGTVAGAAAAAGAAGYLMGHAGGGYGYGMMPGIMGGSGMGSLLFVLLALGVIAYLLMRRTKPVVSARDRVASAPQWSNSTVFSNGGGYWNEDADRIFRELQDINGREDVQALRSYCTETLSEALLSGLGGKTTVVSLQSKVVDESAGAVSIRYQGIVMDQGRDPENLDELWHFIKNPQPGGRTWLLAGIQEV